VQIVRDLLESNITRSILAALAICVSFIIYRLNRKRKALSYRIVTKTTLFDIDREIGSRVQVLLDGEPADKIGLVLIDIENTGNEPIRPDDFIKPLIFTFAPGTRVISADVTATKPDNLDATVSFEASNVTVEPLLMNAGDQMSIKVLLRQFDGTVKGDARIVGVREVRRRYENAGLEVARTATSLSMITTLLAGLVSALGANIVSDKLPSILSRSSAILTSVILPLFAAVLGYYFGRVREFKKPREDDSQADRSDRPSR